MSTHLLTGLLPLAKDEILNEKIKMPSVFRSLNYLALTICSIYPFFLFLSGNLTLAFFDILTCMLPALFCITVIYFIHIKKMSTAMFISFVCVPISIAIKATYEPIGGIMLFPLSQAIVSFFVLRNKNIIATYYFVSVLCFSEITIYYEYLKYNEISKEFVFLLLNLALFVIMVYFIFSYLKNTIEEHNANRTKNEKELSEKNTILKTQNKLILEQSKQLEKKQQLLINAADHQEKISSLLSHDIRTSVMAFKNIFATYRRGFVTKEELMDYVPMLEREAENMNTLFDDILSLAKEKNMPDEKLKEKVDPEILIKEVCLAYDGIASSKQIGLHYYISTPKLVYVNPKFVKIILRNLISNAIKFTRPGGSIYISNIIKDGGSYKILVQDNGDGMCPEKLEKIRRGVGLTSKGTSNETGTGLGLSFCREFVSRCGGILEVQSELGKGTTFSFTLPIADWKATA